MKTRGRPPMSYGHNCGYHGCREGTSYTFKELKVVGAKRHQIYRAVDILDGRKGWVIGHYDGQGEIRCPDHATTVYDPYLLNKVWE